jgi:hypothetical protein
VDNFILPINPPNIFSKIPHERRQNIFSKILISRYNRIYEKVHKLP